MVALARTSLALSITATVLGWVPAHAQTVELPDLPQGNDDPEPLAPQIIVEPAISFSNVSLKLWRSETSSDERTGANIGETVELELLQPFNSSPYGAHVAQQGLGSVRSAQVVFSLRQAPLMSEQPSEGRRRPVSTIELLAAVGHRSFYQPTSGDNVYRVPFALGARVGFNPGRVVGRLGAPRYTVGFQYRLEYIPNDATQGPIRLASAVISGSIDGTFSNIASFEHGLSYRLTGAYDLSRGIRGAELTVSTAFLEYPRLIVGINFRVQTRDNDSRTRDNRFHVAPSLSVQF